jgi:hypothetical protein
MTVSSQENVGIGYMPDYAQYLARGKRRQETEKLDQHLPKGFPPSLSGDLVWDGKDLADVYNWNYYLTSEDIDEINSALQQFKCMLLFYSAWLNCPTSC